MKIDPRGTKDCQLGFHMHNKLGTSSDNGLVSLAKVIVRSLIVELIILENCDANNGNTF